MKQSIKEKIQQRRLQMMVHSYLYYEKDVNIISDSKWSQWAMELRDLQQKYPKESAEVKFYEDFKDWDGSSGAFLKFPENLKIRAEKLYEAHTRPKVVKKVQHKRKSKISAKKLF